MAKWHFSFVADGGKFEHIMETLVPLKIENLEFKIVAGTSKKLRAGDKPAWAMVAEIATDKPQPSSVFHELLRKAGHKDAHSGIDMALKKKLVRKTKTKTGGLQITKVKAK